MKKNRLRGILLGVSLALLLAGGVALAREVDLGLEIDQPCFECCDRPQVTGNPLDSLPPEDDECVVDFTVDGYTEDPVDWFFAPQCPEGQFCIGLVFSQYPPGPPPSTGQLYAFCDTRNLMWLWGYGGLAAPSLPTALGDPLPEELPFTEYGEYSVGACQGVNNSVNGVESCAEVNVLYLRECPGEFVPEPGSIMLLGSGLMGLAGYATLRWRTRQ